jgi:hypothetical protein
MVSFSTFRELGYSNIQEQTLTQAHRLASRALNRHPQSHEHSGRLAQTILDFYHRGIKDVGVISTLAANREKALEVKAAKLARRVERIARIGRRKGRAPRHPENRVE